MAAISTPTARRYGPDGCTLSVAVVAHIHLPCLSHLRSLLLDSTSVLAAVQNGDTRVTRVAAEFRGAVKLCGKSGSSGPECTNSAYIFLKDSTNELVVRFRMLQAVVFLQRGPAHQQDVLAKCTILEYSNIIPTIISPA